MVPFRNMLVLCSAVVNNESGGGHAGAISLDKLFCSLLLWCLIIVKLQVVYSFESSLRFYWVGKG